MYKLYIKFGAFRLRRCRDINFFRNLAYNSAWVLSWTPLHDWSVLVLKWNTLYLRNLIIYLIQFWNIFPQNSTQSCHLIDSVSLDIKKASIKGDTKRLLSILNERALNSFTTLQQLRNVILVICLAKCSKPIFLNIA